MSDTDQPIITTEEVVDSGETVDVIEEPISLADIQNERDVIFQREQTMKDKLTSGLLNWSVMDIKPKLVSWALLGYPPNYEILRLEVDLVPVCADGVSRSIHQFIEYCIGCTLSDVLNKFYSKFTGFIITYQYSSNHVSICAVKS